MITGLSDHNLIFVVRKLAKKCFSPCHLRNPGHLRIPEGEQSNFENAIKGIKWNDILSYFDVESDSYAFQFTIQTIMNDFLKGVKSSHRQKKYSSMDKW